MLGGGCCCCSANGEEQVVDGEQVKLGPVVADDAEDVVGITIGVGGATSGGEETSARFEVELHKGAESDAIGLQLDLQHESGLEILRVKEGGLVHRYNRRATEERRVQEGFFITQVNDKQQDPKAMSSEMTTQRHIRLQVAPKEEFEARMAKASGVLLGLTVHFEDRDKNIFSQAHLGATKRGLGELEAKREAMRAVEEDQDLALVVLGVQAGCVKAYNETVEPRRRILAWDRIKAVNGVRGKPRELLRRMQQTEAGLEARTEPTLVLTVSRPAA